MEGRALSLVCVDESRLLKDIEKLLKRPLPTQVVDGFAPDPTIKPEPIQMGRGRGAAPLRRSAPPSPMRADRRTGTGSSLHRSGKA
jgi:ATP-dependent RNA helicase RhlE